MTLTRAAADDSILNVAIVYLIHDLRSASVHLFGEAAESDTSRQRLPRNAIAAAAGR